MAASKTRRVFNPGDQPVVIDSDGHVLAGGDWADVDPTRHGVSDLVSRRRLLFPDDEQPHGHRPNKTPAPAAENQE